MSDNPSTPTTSDQNDQEAFVIAGVDFHAAGFPREFTQRELGVYDQVAKEYDLRSVEKSLGLLITRQATETLDAPYKAQEKRVAAIENRLDAVLEQMAEKPETWDDEKLRPLEERLVREVAKLKELTEGQVRRLADDSDDVVDEGNRLQAQRDQIHMRIAHALASLHDLNPSPINDWLQEPSVTDLDNAATLVEVGVTSVPLNREQRRRMAKTGAGASSGFGL